jgi:5-methylcytosine-specific restriction endonuclease McrA
MPYKDPIKKKEKQQKYSKKHYVNNTQKVKDATRKSNNTFKVKWKEFKATLSCLECGANHPAVLDFHHIDPEMKNASVHMLVKSKSYKKALEEIQQCVVLCSNCHRVYHYNERRAEKVEAEAPTEINLRRE